MENNSRVKNSTRNMAFAILAYLLQVVLGFLVRRYFIYYFNEEYLGLNSLFSNVLSILSLAELGFGSALVFAMYKPMAEGDTSKVCQLLAFYKKCYTIIGFVVLGLGLCVFPFMDYFKSKAPNVDVSIYVVYLIYLLNNVVSYFFAYRRSLLYTSQRTDIESKVGMVVNFLTSVLQLGVILIVKNYYLYISTLIISSLLNNIIIYIITQRKFGEYVKKPNTTLTKEEKKAINKNVFSLLFHKIGGVIVFSTDSLIIYIFLNSATLGKYSNYTMITGYVAVVFSTIIGALRGSIGNSIASQDRTTNYKLFNKLNFLYMWIVSFCAICIFTLSDPFIDVVLTKGGSILTLDQSILFLLTFSFYLTNSRYMLNTFKECSGLFYQDRYKAIIESIINLVASLVLVSLIGLPGVIIGTIISTISTCLWVEPYVLNKHYFKKSTLAYLGRYLIYTGAMLISGVTTYFVCNLIQINTIWTLIAKFAICAVVPNVMLLICLCWMPEFKECVKWGMEIIKGFLHRKKRVVPVGASEESMSSVDIVVSNIDVDKDGLVDLQVTMPVIDASEQELTDDNSETE